MRLKPSFKKVVISLIAGAVCALALLVLTFFGIDYGIVIPVVVFIVVSAMVYLVWSLTQPEFYEWE
ncbi:hypothetical protein A3K73_06610 [Candidatus Pacearchaeota archaeon RBG_13_36_9]|nr:MAG: hypothetical protein A3K73_06610 [Candidatus Pacearchaeota archaeon RBG_13_36_9]